LPGLHGKTLSQKNKNKIIKTGSLYVTQVGFKLSILLLVPPECEHYRHAPPCLAETLSLKKIKFNKIKYLYI
jgi:hypothetical protein